MNLLFDTDHAGRFVCTLVDGANTAIATAVSVAEAAQVLEAALADVRAEGCGECVWAEAAGEYRWMFRRGEDRLTVVVLWSAGTLTGWQHVFRAECNAAWFDERVRTELEKLRRLTPSA
jgi:hypothetical protein